MRHTSLSLSLILALGIVLSGAGRLPDVSPVTLGAPTPPSPERAELSAQADSSEPVGSERVGTGELAPPMRVPSRTKVSAIERARSLPRTADLIASASPRQGALYVKQEGRERRLTIELELQRQLEAILRDYQVPFAAVVAIEPQTGRVLAMAEHSDENPRLRGLSVQAVYPAASIFKIVTAAALLDEGVKPDDSECFHGGKRRLTEALLVDSHRDSRCFPLSTALAMSANVVFAKLTKRFLSPTKLRATAEAFYFNRALPFEMPVDVSLASIPEEPFALSNTGAGFGDVYLSPLHGAVVAAVAANEGVLPLPTLFDDEGRPDGAAARGERVISKEQARALTDMLEETVTSGTARRVFRERGHRVPGAVGKTGSLADRKPFRDYSWFVGFAPKESPKIAVASVVVNGPRWRIRATWLGREAMRLHLAASGAHASR